MRSTTPPRINVTINHEQFNRGTGCRLAGAVLLRFGYCGGGALGGLRARNWNNVATNANWNIGFAVILLTMEL